MNQACWHLLPVISVILMQIAIQYPGEQFIAKRFEYAYTIQYMPGSQRYQLSAIERWTH